MWVVAGLLPAATFSLGTAIHLYTVYLTFDAFGWFWAVAAFFGAFFAQAFWLYVDWQSGEGFRLFALACLCWITLAAATGYSRRY